jgi:signal transduction histidine kinase
MDEIAQAFYIEDSPFGPDISRELKIEEDVSPPIMKATKQFQQSLRNLLEHIETNEKQHLFEDDEFEKLTKTDKLLQNIKQLVPYPEHRPGTLLEASRSVIRICRDATAREVIPRELCRDVISRGGTIENLACLQRIHAFASLIVETDYEVEALRGFLNYYHKRPETFTVESVSSMLGDSIELMSGYAKSKRIKLRRSASHADAMVKVVRPDITSAINNVLQNAIKYSWQSRSHQYVVHVRHYQIQEMVAIEIENTGVPIPQNEIDSGIIFEMGFRGRKSGERARRGTGIGLHESREIVESHLGKITITSTPMGDDPEASPNKTIVTIYLPIHAG